MCGLPRNKLRLAVEVLTVYCTLNYHLFVTYNSLCAKFSFSEESFHIFLRIIYKKHQYGFISERINSYRKSIYTMDRRLWSKYWNNNSSFKKHHHNHHTLSFYNILSLLIIILHKHNLLIFKFIYNIYI